MELKGGLISGIPHSEGITQYKELGDVFFSSFFLMTPSGYQRKTWKKEKKRWSVLKNETPATSVEEFVEEKFQLGALQMYLGNFSKCALKFRMHC